ncbi:MAG: ParB N-terminal domain-containing protein [Deltaproteobacteria bacterium]|nr:ParB N-terminal domain-containing protein [Deltaproteobacteria bacterium]
MVNIDNIRGVAHQKVELASIDDFPGPYCMSFGFDLGPLVRSLEGAGLLNPPLLTRDENGRFTIVAGYRRIKALKQMKVDTATCRIIPVDEIPPAECLLMNLYDNLAVRELNPVEKGMALTCLNCWFSTEEIVGQYMALLGLPPNRATLSSYLRFEEKMEIQAKEAVALGRLSFRNAMLLADLDPVSRSALVDLMSNLKFTISQQAHIIDYVTDLALIEGETIPEVLSDSRVRAIVGDSLMNKPQKGRRLISYLRRRRMPRLSKAEKDFRKVVADLNLDKMVRIEHSPFFESPFYRLEVLFRDGQSLREKLEKLMSEDLEKIGDPWKDNGRGD